MMAASNKKQPTSKEVEIVSGSAVGSLDTRPADESHTKELIDSLSLSSIPDDVRTAFLSPLLGTQCIIGSLSLVRKALHTIATDPQMHRTIFLKSTVRPKTRAHEKIRLTDGQLDVWCPRFTLTNRVTMLCPLNESLARVIEATHKTLTHLEADDSETRGGGGGAVRRFGRPTFSMLTHVVVAGRWVRVAGDGDWVLSSLESLRVSSSTSCCHRWHQFSRALHTLELDHPAGPHWGRDMPAGVDLSSLKHLTVISNGSFDMGRWDAQRLSECGLRLDAFDMTTRRLLINSTTSMKVRQNLFPLPAAFLSRIGHMFPHVTEADLFAFEGEGLASLVEGDVQPVLEQLGNLTVVRCYVDVEEGLGKWSLLVDEAGEGGRPFHERISRMAYTIELSELPSYDEGGWAGAEEFSQTVASQCILATSSVPCLNSIVLEVDRCWGQGREEDSHFLSAFEQVQLDGGRFHALLRAAGFDLVELTPLGHLCRVEVRRISFVGDPMQRKITDYFSAVQ